MIFATVGTQLPFNRLIDALDRMAPSLGKKVIAQIGSSERQPVNIEWHQQLTPIEFQKIFASADLIVSHAGVGTILNAKRLGKPIVLLPRRAHLGEHRNDHQLATVKQLAGHKGIYVAHDESELLPLLMQPMERPEAAGGPRLEALKSYIHGYIRSR